MTRPAIYLILYLRFAATILLLALAAVFFPFPWMDAVHHWLGLGDLPNRPMVLYLARSNSAIYAAHGIVLIFLSLDVERYVPLLRLLGWGKMVFGLLILSVDLAVGMPVLWTVIEGPIIAAYGLVLLWLVRYTFSVRRPLTSRAP